MAKMSLTELKALLEAERNDALAAIAASKLSAERADAMDYYLGDMARDMPAPEGRSRAVSTDVADTVEGIMPSLMEIFCSGDEIVKFAPVGPNDTAAAEQETDYVNHVFLERNPGFLILYTFIKDALLSKTGIVKVWWETRTLEERETYYDLTDDAFAILAADPDIEITAHTVRPALPPPLGDPSSLRFGGQGSVAAPASATAGEDQPAGGPLLHDVECVRAKEAAEARVEAVPPEEFGISRNARSLRDCDYCFHKILIQHAKLIAEGYDPEQVKTLPTYTAIANVEEVRRDTVDEYQYTGDENNQAARRVETTEHYIRMDYKGDGKACLYKVRTGGRQGDILIKDGKPDIVEFDDIPFAAMTPVIQTHRFFGRSLADLVMDIQRIKTAILRGVLDNVYLANNPRVEVAEQFAGPETLDDLLVSRPGGIVRTKQPGGLNWQVVPSIAAQAFPVMEYMDAMREWRTGVTRQGQGIDADALQNQTATAVNQVFTAAQAKIKLIARIFAETGIKDLFWLLHEIIRKHGQARATVQLRNQWVTIDPREWKKRDRLTVHVGLGSGTRQAQLAALGQVMGLQEKAIQLGMVSKRNLHNSAREFVKLAGLQFPSEYFLDPAAPPDPLDPASAPIASPPNPDMLKAQADQAQGQQHIALTAAKAQADQQYVAAQAQADMAVATLKFEHEKALAEREDARKAALHAMEMQRGHLDLIKTLAALGGRTGDAATVGGITSDAIGGGIGPDGQPLPQQPPQWPPLDLDALIARLAPIIHPPAPPAAAPRPMRVVRDAAGRVSHLEPI
ncbi:MAG TPA: hypothetical protein VGG01_20460 [Xanthobacteraceae bacterium]|jgi:hypothetical protein